jgi:hypothetical protein
LWDAGLVPGPGSEQQKGSVFFGSEDPDALDQALKWGEENNWRVLYSQLFDRRIDVSTGLDWIKQVKMKRKHLEKHHELEYFSMIFNIDYHVRCNAFVCTLPSNFCRLIDELRATVGGKVTRHFAELGIAGCPPQNDGKISLQVGYLNYF